MTIRYEPEDGYGIGPRFEAPEERVLLFEDWAAPGCPESDGFGPPNWDGGVPPSPGGNHSGGGNGNPDVDLVRVYLKDMGRVMLLTKEGEVGLARKIEKGKRKIVKGLVLTPLFLESVRDLEK